MDKDQEVIAHICLFVDLDNKAWESAYLAQDQTDGCEPPPALIYISGSYALGPPLHKTIAEEVERENIGMMAI